ncbi:MAG TPA: glutaredoxin family protein [Pirellulales bacterium]|jgi:glutaredoxin|nr:glutaredoxin family protein [Pirellulales bacterium]
MPPDRAPQAAPPSAVLYTRQGCHLCEDAKAVLLRYGLPVAEVDIDAEPELVTRYGTCVPVVVIDGRERFRGRVSEVLLRRLLHRHIR